MRRPSDPALLVRCYPSAWRRRYGDEFVAVMEQAQADEPRSFRRTADAVRGGLRARLEYAGAIGDVVPAAERTRTGIAVTAFGAVGFALAGVRVLDLALNLPPLSSRAPSAAPWGAGSLDIVTTRALAAAGLAGLVLMMVAAAPVATAVVRSVMERRARRLIGPLAQFAVPVGLYILGVLVQLPRWTAPVPWTRRIESASAVATYPFSDIWGSPLRQPLRSLVWLLLAAVLLVEIGTGAFRLVRAVRLSDRVLRFETRLVTAMAVLTAGVLVPSAWWSIVYAPLADSHGPAPVGTGRFVALAAMAACSVPTLWGAARARRSARGLPVALPGA